MTNRSTLDKWYQWLWKDVLHSTKPITEHCRVFYHNYPLIVILLVSTFSAPMWLYLSLGTVGIIYGSAFGGIVLGHFFWGAPHKGG